MTEALGVEEVVRTVNPDPSAAEMRIFASDVCRDRAYIAERRRRELRGLTKQCPKLTEQIIGCRLWLGHDACVLAQGQGRSCSQLLNEGRFSIAAKTVDKQERRLMQLRDCILDQCLSPVQLASSLGYHLWRRRIRRPSQSGRQIEVPLTAGSVHPNGRAVPIAPTSLVAVKVDCPLGGCEINSREVNAEFVGSIRTHRSSCNRYMALGRYNPCIVLVAVETEVNVARNALSSDDTVG